MMWATISSWSCFCWLYRASPSSAAKNIINLISVLTIWWCSCVESSLVLLEEGVFYDQCVLLAKLLAFALLHFVLQGQTCLLFQVSPDFLLLHSCPVWGKGHFFFFLVLVLGLIGLHRTVGEGWGEAILSRYCNQEKKASLPWPHTYFPWTMPPNCAWCSTKTIQWHFPLGRSS